MSICKIGDGNTALANIGRSIPPMILTFLAPYVSHLEQPDDVEGLQHKMNIFYKWCANNFLYMKAKILYTGCIDPHLIYSCKVAPVLLQWLKYIHFLEAIDTHVIVITLAAVRVGRSTAAAPSVSCELVSSFCRSPRDMVHGSAPG